MPGLDRPFLRKSRHKETISGVFGKEGSFCIYFVINLCGCVSGRETFDLANQGDFFCLLIFIFWGE